VFKDTGTSGKRQSWSEKKEEKVPSYTCGRNKGESVRGPRSGVVPQRALPKSRGKGSYLAGTGENGFSGQTPGRAKASR